jgi:hypothetical protein
LPPSTIRSSCGTSAIGEQAHALRDEIRSAGGRAHVGEPDRTAEAQAAAPIDFALD